MDVAATIHNDRTYVPVRAISEAFSASIQWDNPNRTATIIQSNRTENFVQVRDISGLGEKTLCSAYGVDVYKRQATCRTEQIGRVAAMVSTQSSSESPSAIIVEIIFEVRVERILAFTPLPRPSARTITVEFSP